MSDPAFTLDIERERDFHFDVSFDNPDWPTLRLDEPPPIGDGTAPNPSRVLGTAVGSCLSASLLFCLQKARIPLTGMRAHVEGRLHRNESGRLRIESIRVELRPTFDGPPPDRVAKCLEIFEDFCIVTQSVREGLDVEVSVHPEEAATAST